MPIVISALGTIDKGLVKELGGDHPKYSIIKIGKNTEKGPGELGRFAVTQTPMRNHQLTLVCKTLKGLK